jgi:hypothetical protein
MEGGVRVVASSPYNINKEKEASKFTPVCDSLGGHKLNKCYRVVFY